MALRYCYARYLKIEYCDWKVVVPDFPGASCSAKVACGFTIRRVWGRISVVPWPSLDDSLNINVSITELQCIRDVFSLYCSATVVKVNFTLKSQGVCLRASDWSSLPRWVHEYS